MTSQPDKLFHNKLENFQRTVPTSAWDRIESNLDKNRSKGFWMKIAAGLLLLSVAAFILWPLTISEDSELTSLKNDASPKIKNEKINLEPVTPTVIAKEEGEQKGEKIKQKAAKKTESELIPETKKENINFPIHETTEAQVAVVESPSAEVYTSHTIVYTAEEVNSKYLRKKSTSEATTEEKKSSGMQKLMGLAYELKNNNSGLGDLRQKKDEILALNFLNEDKTKKTKN